MKSLFHHPFHFKFLVHHHSDPLWMHHPTVWWTRAIVLLAIVLFFLLCTTVGGITLLGEWQNTRTFSDASQVGFDSAIPVLVEGRSGTNAKWGKVTETVFLNSTPLANAGDDQVVYVAEVVQLSGTATDPDGAPIVSWRWSFISVPEGSTAALSDPTVQSPTFIPLIGGKYVLSLVASDGKDMSSPDTVVIRVISNVRPVAVRM